MFKMSYILQHYHEAFCVVYNVYNLINYERHRLLTLKQKPKNQIEKYYT